ncbi:MAG TPA: V-type ATP synthase subunit F [Acidimicrobiia bacterium]|nr:V-type ATP synthase subunit F [Acidimicrobiia bacterium]
MSRVAVLGEPALVGGFALAGALVFGVGDHAAIDAAWDALPDDVSVLVLTPRAADRLRDRLDERPQLLTAVSPP